MYKNKGPVKFEKLVIKIVPEDSSRVAAMLSGQFDITHQFPAQFISQAKAAPSTVSSLQNSQPLTGTGRHFLPALGQPAHPAPARGLKYPADAALLEAAKHECGPLAPPCIVG